MNPLISNNINPIREFIRQNKKSISFFLILLLIYIIWRIVSVIIYRFESISPWWDQLYLLGAYELSRITSFLLNWLGYPNDIIRCQNVVIHGLRGIKITKECMALGIQVLFISYILLYPVKTWHKLWVLPAGLFIINFINIWRFIALALIQKYFPAYFTFMHLYVLRITFFGLVFLLCFLWLKRFPIVEKRS